MLIFNVVYRPGSTRRLLPLALSVLQHDDVALGLIDNGASREDTRCLQSTANNNRNGEYHRVDIAGSMTARL